MATGNVTTYEGTGFEIPGPSSKERGFQALASMMGGMQKRQQAKEAQLTAAMPALIANKQIQPWNDESKGKQLKYAGMPWEMTEGAGDIDTLLKQAKYMNLMNPVATPHQMATTAASIAEAELGKNITYQMATPEVKSQMYEAAMDRAMKASQYFHGQYMKNGTSAFGGAPGGAGVPGGSKKKSFRVKKKSTGQTGTIPQDEFDPKLYEKI